MTDAIFQIEIKISELLKKNIDSLNLPIVLKNALKKIKNLFIPQTKGQEKEQNAKETSEASRGGEKNNDRIRIRNRSYNIKRILAKPKNIDVKHNGRVVRRMVVRKSTIYPSTRRRQEY